MGYLECIDLPFSLFYFFLKKNFSLLLISKIIVLSVVKIVFMVTRSKMYNMIMRP